MSTPPHPPAASAAAEPPTRPRRWRRWLLSGAGILVALGLGITAAVLAVMFPSRDSLQWPVLPPADYAYASQSRRVVARLLDEPARLVHTAGAGAPAPLSGFDYARHSPYLPQDRQAAQRVFSVAAGEVLLEESLAGVAHASSVYEGRYALHLPAGEATRWPLAQVPAGSTLSLGVAGLPPHRDVTLCPVEITVTVQGAAGATDHPLGRLGESPQDFGWRDHELPLPAGATAVTFTAKAAAGCDGPGHAFLADPTVWAPRQGPAPINVLYINVCTWRADDLGPEARGATPKLDALAATGRRFTQARSNANWSKASQISALTGRYASTLGLKHHRVPVGQLEGLSYAHSQWPTLASVLRGAGYETAALVDNIFLADFLRVGVDLGFARFVDNARHIHNTVDLMREAVAWLTAHGDRPFFLYLNPANPHFRYRPPREYLGQIGFGWADLTGDLQHALHLGEVAYTDDAVGELLEAVRRLGLAERTLVVMHGDHGETLSWARDLEVKVPAAHKARESMIYKTTRYKHGWSWQETEIRIPLLFARPGAVPPAVDDRPASPIDVAPTILAHLGLPKPPTMLGRDLFRAGPTAPIVVDGKGFDAVVDGPLKLVRFWPGYGWWRRKHTGEVSDSPVLLFDLA
ncbi:MAG: sulfatase, partial [Myxococcales bacterium]|nr:sulfatase [Myxococcales bacterium]